MENKVKVWIARDKNGSLYAFSNPPIKLTDHHWGFSTCIILDESIFPSVQWKDDEPTEAYITLAEPQEQPKQEIDWEQRRYEIAKEMMYKIYRQQVAVSNKGQGIEMKIIVDVAVTFADMLINELKNKNK